MRVTWLAVNASFAHSSPALPCIHAACTAVPGAEWSAVRVALEEPAVEIARRVAELRPDVMAASLYLFNRHYVLDVLGRVRALLPHCRIAVGGPECAGNVDDLLAPGTGIDAVFRGEGEATFPAWLAAFADGGPVPALPGLCFREPDGIVCDGGKPRPWPGFATGSPVFDDPLFDASKPFAILETARGCPSRCAFCTSCGDSPVRKRPIARVRADVTACRRRGIRELRVADRTFNASPRRACALLRMFREEFPDLQFHLEIHPAQLGPSVRDELRRARPGQLHVEAGIQSLDDAVLAAVDRPGRAREALDGLRFLVRRRNAFDVHADLLAGLPEQTFDSLLRDTVSLVRLGPAEIQLETLKILPGTPLRDRATAEGLVFAPSPPYDVMRTPTLSLEDMRLARGLSVLVDRFCNPAGLRDAFRAGPGRSVTALRAFLASADRAAMLGTPVSLRRRFEFMHRVCESPLVRRKLRVAWMLAGLPATGGICETEVWRESGTPDGAECVFGDPAAVGGPDCRGRILRDAEAAYLFFYDRKLSHHRPVAAFRVPSGAQLSEQ